MSRCYFYTSNRDTWHVLLNLRVTNMLADDRKFQIIEAAIDVFGTYGYKKTSMKDIADALDISRPALYQYYKNKESIFLALVDHMLELGEQAAIRGFGRSDDHFDCLLHGVQEMERVIFSPIFSKPNGKELFLLSKKMAPNLMEEFEERFLAHIVLNLEKAQEEQLINFRALDIGSREVAQLLLLGIDGIKRASHSQDELDRQTELYITIFWRGLRC
ncbi:TetR/AcrR family transcriptional regulator [Vibrio sp. RC27]